jgi:quercetin dioxygenase-like cupin family protein
LLVLVVEWRVNLTDDQASCEVAVAGSQPSQAPAAVKLQRLAAELAKNPVDCPVYHHFSPGVYAREMRVPAGAAVIGKVHKFENMLVMSAGEATFLLGDQPVRVCAPQIWVSPPGTQRAAFAHTDCVFISVHGTHKTDLAEIEAEFIAQDMIEYEQFLLTCAEKGE